MSETAVRPTPWGLPPDGFHFEVHVAGEWIVPAVGAGRCRSGLPSCKAPAAATLMRSNGPWDYCAEHLYGGWIEDAKVMRWRLVRDEA